MVASFLVFYVFFNGGHLFARLFSLYWALFNRHSVHFRVEVTHDSQGVMRSR